MTNTSRLHRITHRILGADHLISIASHLDGCVGHHHKRRLSEAARRLVCLMLFDRNSRRSRPASCWRSCCSPATGPPTAKATAALAGAWGAFRDNGGRRPPLWDRQHCGWGPVMTAVQKRLSPVNFSRDWPSYSYCPLKFIWGKMILEGNVHLPYHLTTPLAG